MRMGAARFPAILNPHQCTAFLPIAMSEYLFRKNIPETMVNQGINKCSFPINNANVPFDIENSALFRIP